MYKANENMQSEEYSLIKQCVDGDGEVYAILVERYQEMVYNIAYRMLGDAETARDISQESFISAYEALENFKNSSKFSTWLCSIVMNKCRDYLRCKKVDISIDDVRESLFSTMPDPEGSMYQKQLGRTLQKAIGALPEDYRQVIVLKHIEGFDYKEMESILGVSANALKVRTCRAREMLKKFLLETRGTDG